MVLLAILTATAGEQAQASQAHDAGLAANRSKMLWNSWQNTHDGVGGARGSAGARPAQNSFDQLG
eukprot:11603692-Alexandrium_andersonii.AAC.1